jgi:hypothetical protein
MDLRDTPLTAETQRAQRGKAPTEDTTKDAAEYAKYAETTPCGSAFSAYSAYSAVLFYGEIVRRLRATWTIAVQRFWLPCLLRALRVSAVLLNFHLGLRLRDAAVQ